MPNDNDSLLYSGASLSSWRKYGVASARNDTEPMVGEAEHWAAPWRMSRDVNTSWEGTSLTYLLHGAESFLRS